MAIDIKAAFESEPEPLDFVVPGLLAGTVGALVPPGRPARASGRCKQRLGVACSETGGDLLDLQPTDTGPAVYFAAEDPEIVVRRRLRAIGEHLPPDARDAIAERVYIAPLVAKGFNLVDDQQLGRAIEYCADCCTRAQGQSCSGIH